MTALAAAGSVPSLAWEPALFISCPPGKSPVRDHTPLQVDISTL